MGLDNGIYIKHLSKDKLPFYFKDYYNELGSEGIELAYWRKCWGIRDKIINKFDFPQDGGTYKIEHDEIKVLIRIIKYFLNSDNWNNEAESIWEYEEYLDNMLDILTNLRWLEAYLGSCSKEEKDKIEIFFYDSY